MDKNCPNCKKPMDGDQYCREVQVCPDLDAPHCAACCPWKTATPGYTLSILVAPGAKFEITAAGGNGGDGMRRE
jgi:hypothetical protein